MEAAVSVVVPVYNVERLLERCVDSILKQSLKELEIILVDDGSTDGSGSLCDVYARKDQRIRVLHKDNGGLTSAWKAGLGMASAPYVGFVDSDDYLEPEMLVQMTGRLAGVPGEIVCCDHVVEKQRGTEEVKSGTEPGIYEGDRLREQIKAKLIGEEKKVIPLSRCMKLCEKSLFEGNETYYDYSLRFGDDTNLMYPAFLESSRVVIMKDAFYYHYRYVEGSLVHGYDEGLFAGVERLMEAVGRTAEEKRAPDAVRAVAREHCYMLMYVMKNELRAPDKGYRKRIQAIFGEENIKTMLHNTPVAVTERSNQLLYMGMLYPGGVLLRVLRLILRLYDRR